jgi:hypothetical protein
MEESPKLSGVRPELTAEQKAEIDAMNREQMCRLWRFEPIGSPLFQGARGDYFKTRFDALGGFSPELSKLIGWDS